ncbi:MAG: SEC-C domain-containing protein [Clostridia bacterium]|nr:SEC-C domain-containing protein [Clostridia bacterium]
MSTLHENLVRLTRRDLEVAMLRFGENPDDYPKKADLVRAAEEAVKAHPLTPLMSVGPEGVLTLRRYLRQGVTLLDTLVRGDPVLSDTLHQLQSFGLAWHTRGRYELTVQAKLLVLGMNKTQLKLLRAHDALYTAIHGCLNLYGMLSPEELTAILEQSGMFGLSVDAVLHAYLLVCHPDNVLFLPEEEAPFLVCTDELDDPAWLYGELQRSPLLPRAVFRQEDFLRADRLPGKPEIFASLKDWLKRKGAFEDQIEHFLYELTFCYMNDPDAPQSVFIDLLLDFIPQIKTALTPAEERILMTTLEQLPLWTLRGYAAIDRQHAVARQSAAGRDDYCPCGSGRKYRNCCGNFH